MTDKKRGPVPKPKGEAKAFVYLCAEISTMTKEIRVQIEIRVNANQYATRDNFRKAAKKAIDSYFKDLINEGTKRAQAGCLSAKAQICGIPVQATGTNKRRKEGTTGRYKRD